MRELSEKELVKRLKARDPKAFEELLRRYEGRVYNYGLRMCGDREDALEVAQEVFMRAYAALPKFREDSRLTTWLFRIMANSCLMKRRKSKFAPKHIVSLEGLPEEGRATLDIEDPRSDLFRDALDREVRDALAKAVEELDPGYRAVFLLRDMENLSTAEVAEILDLSEAAVKSRLHRARLFLRERLAPLVERG
jgi:RNA polymerase sigma-70 factor (ECF subfamily)